MKSSIAVPRGLRLFGALWLVWVLLVGGHNLWLWTVSGRALDTDILAMLPRDEQQPVVVEATRRLADAGARRVVVLVGGGDWASAQRGGDAFAQEFSGLDVNLRYRVDDGAAQQYLELFAPAREGLLTAAGRLALSAQAPADLAAQAVVLLHQPMGAPRVGSWAQDPLNLFGQWLVERAQSSRVRVQEGRLALQDERQQWWAVLMLETQGSGFALASQQALLPRLEQGRRQALAAGAAQVLATGVPLFAAAAATQAQNEVHVIGLGSLAGIIVLTLFAFSSLRPRILVTLSIAVGLLSAISICSVLFERLHLITLVFGASLIGVAENYGTNYFCARLGLAPQQRFEMLRAQAPVMWLAMLTTVIGYALLALTPFPGLQQMAVFSALGLLCSFITVMLWFPLLDGGRMDETRFSRWLGSRRAKWPSLGRNRFSAGLALMSAALLAAGAMLLRGNDDIRLLQNAPPDLVRAQREVGRLLELPGVAQFIIVRGANVQQVLEREEALKVELDQLRAQGQLDAYQAISDWVPSMTRQRQDQTLVNAKIFAAGDGVLALAEQRLGQALQRTSSSSSPLAFEAWLAAPISEPLRHQWLGPLEGGVATAVLLRGVDTASAQAAVQAAAQRAGVIWVDKVAEVSRLLGRYRVIMAAVIVLGYGLVWLALAWRFGRTAWRALAPTALASLLSLALLACLGQPLQLFHVLPLLILLGLGVDYGIFMLEQPARSATRPFLSITLAAASTLLSFGLLALSGTPALRAFGLTMLLGISLAWALTPVFLPSSSSTALPTKAEP
ncbi:MMPL family transporter [Roseateles oligotrophus]|uniref:Transporter n=1 Tax=Roseateles oligotrophus TaxID=1769250 RepID=A0ABT2YDH8_9BURK|nr:MMPL family transporter [Roseateles oligotrophus]MCV2368079.1 transporter [Roseateles oligotrophus]